MGNWNTELKDFLAAYGTSRKMSMAEEDQKMQRESHAESMLGAQQQRMFQAETQPLQVNKLKQELEHQRLVIEKAEQILPYEIENARLGNIKTQADIRHTESSIRLTSQNIANAAYNLSVLKEGADSRKAQNELKAAEARASLSILPQTQAAALATAEEKVLDTENKRKDQLANANVLLQQQSGPALIKMLEEHPEAKKLFKDEQGNWLPEDQIKKGLNQFTASRVQDVDTQKAQFKWGKPSAALTAAKEFEALTARAMAGDAEAARLAKYMARSKGYNDVTAMKQEIIAAYETGQPINPSDLKMVMLLGMNDPLMIALWPQLEKSPRYSADFQEALNSVTAINRATAGVGAVQSGPIMTKGPDGKTYPEVTQDQLEQFLSTAPRPKPGQQGMKFIYKAPDGTRHLKEIE